MNAVTGVKQMGEREEDTARRISELEERVDDLERSLNQALQMFVDFLDGENARAGHRDDAGG